MKKVSLSLALVLGLVTLSIAATPKGETKEAAETTTAPSETATKDVLYYWFDTNAAGNALEDPSGIDESQPPSALGNCQGSQADFCQRGFTEEQTSVDESGMRTPNVSITSGQADHKQ